MKRTVNRVIARLAMFLIAIVLGAIAVAQAQRGVDARRSASAQTPTAKRDTVVPPIPLETKLVKHEEPEDSFQPSIATASDESGYAADVVAGYDSAPQSAADAYVSAPPPIQTTANDFGDQQEFAGDPTPGPPAARIAPPAAMTTDLESEPSNDYVSAPANDFNQTTYDPPPSADFAAQESYQADDFQSADPYLADHETTTDAPPMDPLPPMQATSPPPAAIADTPTPTYHAVQPTQPIEPYNAIPQGQVLPPAQAMPMMQANNQTALADRSYDVSTTTQVGFDSGDRGTGKPGPSELEGPQTPSLTITKKSPPEVQVGQPAKFHVTVRNQGQVAAHEVVIRDEVPHGTQLVSTNPPANRGGDGALLWQMGTLRPGAEITAMMEIMPVEEGDVGSVATVSFQTSASSRTLATKPQLTLEHTAERQVLVGDDVIFQIKIANNGSGAAHNVTLEETVPRGLQHYDGNELEYSIGTLQPGETRMLELKLKAAEAGLCGNLLMARADGNVAVEDQCEIDIVAPQIRLEITGPRRRFLERKATYEVHLANPGTAAARNIEVIAHLPRALKFLNTNNAGKYDAQRHVVVWNLAELPAQEMGTVELETMPKQMGNHSIQVEARASMGLADAVEHDVTVEGLVALLYTVTDVSDPIEVGGQTTYEIHVVNQGSKTASNLRVGAMIPPGMEAINGEGPTRVAMKTDRVVFEPLPRLAPQADTFYKIHVKGLAPGDKRIQVQLMSDDVTEPVTKEESTHVYADE